VVLDGGKIAEQGTHNQLAAAGGLYAQLMQSQQKDETQARPVD
jgi:ATP-binding cassette subfamily B protein